MSRPTLTPAEAARVLREGGVIAYPTEAVYGLGCDPLDARAVSRILELKSRPAAAGLILITDDFERVSDFVGPVADEEMDRARSTWPGPVTWLFPRSAMVPGWISGDHDSVAVRVTAHPVCRELCAAFGGAIVSTSANKSGDPPARSVAEVMAALGSGIDAIVGGELGAGARPSEIRDVRSGEVLRSG